MTGPDQTEAGSHPVAAALTEDDFLGGRLKVLQPAGSYRSGLDAVLLAAAAPARDDRTERVLDAGAGVGVVGLCVMARCPAARVTLLERDPGLAAIARRNVVANHVLDRANVIELDVLEPGVAARHFGNGAGAFDHVLANPPFHVEGAGTRAPDPVKATANAMPAGSLDHWVRFLAGAVVSGGTATVIHRADALAELLAAMQRRFGAIIVLPVHPREREPANRVLVQGVKGSRAPLSLSPGLILHAAGHGFTPGVEQILRHGAPLAIGRRP